MAKKRHLISSILGLIIGFLLASSTRRPSKGTWCPLPSTPINRTTHPSQDLLLVGVMTASKYVDNRARAVYETWGKHVPGKIIFFSSEQSWSKSIPLVALPGIDDRYPPQRKSFQMLKYMHDHHIDQFEWFLRADDDVYVRTDRLEQLLKSVDSSKPWFIGQTGKGNNEEFGLLSLDNDENFCMGGPGVIMSRETLRRIAPHVDHCLQHLYTTHEDVELGRCVRKFAGVPCTWSYEMQVILYHNQSGAAAFTGNLKQKEVHRAITMHPIKHSHHMYRLHNYVKGLQIQDLQYESIALHRDLLLASIYLNIPLSNLHDAEIVEDLHLFPEPRGSPDYLGDSKILGKMPQLNRFQPRTSSDVFDWELISKSLFSYKDLNPRRRIGSSLKEGLSDLVREVMELINLYSKQRGRIIDFKEILYAYWRLDPLHGVDLILDMSLVYKKYRGHKMTVPVRRHAYLQQSFTGIEVREVFPSEHHQLPDNPLHFNVLANLNLPLPLLAKQTRNGETFINFILPLSGRYETFQRFLKRYEEVCIQEAEATRLLVVLYKTGAETHQFAATLQLLNAIKRRYRTSDINYKIIEEEFSRGRALKHGVDEFANDQLLFFIDVDITFDRASLFRIRANTIRHRQLYFPIVYSLYKGNVDVNSAFSINNADGFWRQFGFGIVSLYKSDFRNLGGFNQSIAGWGMEDVAFYDSAIKSNLRIVRSVDVGLVHVYHPVVCNSTLEKHQKDMCIGTQANMFGSLQQLQKLYRQYKYLFR